MKYFFFVLFSMCQILHADPWGKDADLAYKPQYCNPECKQTGFGVQVAERLIRFHKEVISPADGPRSHFKPNSSQYTLDAIRKYGFLKGYILGCDRLMRENNEEWVYKKTLDKHGFAFKQDSVK